jgi:hypothetical protein
MILKEMKKKCSVLYKGFFKRGNAIEGGYQEIMMIREKYNLIKNDKSVEMKSIWDLSKYKHYCGFRIALANADS